MELWISLFQWIMSQLSFMFVAGGIMYIYIPLRLQYDLCRPSCYKHEKQLGHDSFENEIHSSIWSTKTFLYEIRELSYMQNNIGYQILRIWSILYRNLILPYFMHNFSSILEIWRWFPQIMFTLLSLLRTINVGFSHQIKGL